MRSLLAFAVVVGLASAAPVPKSLQRKDEAGPLVGLWKPVADSRTYYDFRPDGSMRCWTEGNERSAAAYQWAVHPGSSPKRMTWHNDGKAWEAIYELEGDSLTIAYRHAKLNPPEKVGPNPDGHFETLTRQPAK